MEMSSAAYDAGKLDNSFNYLVEAFQTIPEPRKEYNKSYNHCSYILDFILSEKYRMSEAKNWLDELTDIANYQKCWEGSIDFFAAKTNFQLGNYEIAKKQFDESVKVGKGFRYFEDEDPKYKDFYLHPEKYTDQQQ